MARAALEDGFTTLQKCWRLVEKLLGGRFANEIALAPHADLARQAAGCEDASESSDGCRALRDGHRRGTGRA